VNKARRKTPNKELHNKTALRVILIHFALSYYLLFTLYALYVPRDTLRIFSAALPCFSDFAQHIWIDSNTTVRNSLPKVTKISDFNSIHRP
jgi:hypothetical protein